MTVEIDDQNYRALLRLHNSTNGVVKELTAENEHLRGMITFLENEVKILRAKDKTRNEIMTRAITDLNQKNGENLRVISELRTELKRCKGPSNGDKH